MRFRHLFFLVMSFGCMKAQHYSGPGTPFPSSPAPSSNVYFGYEVDGGGSGNTGDYNVAVGHQTGYLFKNASRNTLMGYKAGYSELEGDDNSVFGSNAGQLGDGSKNVFMGSGSGYSTLTNENTFAGYRSGYNDQNAGGGTYFGAYTGENNAGNMNVFFGYSAGRYNSTGHNHLFGGFMAGLHNTTGVANVFLGSRAGATNTQGSYNIAVGQQAGFANTTGGANVFIGHGAGIANDTGNENVYIGNQSGSAGTSKGTNTFIGAQSGKFATGSGNVFLGFTAGRHEDGSNKLHITNFDNDGNVTPPLIYGDFTTRKIGIGLPNYFPASDRFPVTVNSGVDSVTGYKLFVKGGLVTDACQISAFSTWADYVFEDNYDLRTLEEVECFIKENRHLPNIPSAQKVAEEGFEVKQMLTLQQEKIEELTLYLIEQNKQIKSLQIEIQNLKSQKK